MQKYDHIIQMLNRIRTHSKRLQSAKLVAGKAMLSHLYRNNACGINWPAAIKMLDYNVGTQLADSISLLIL